MSTCVGGKTSNFGLNDHSGTTFSLPHNEQEASDDIRSLLFSFPDIMPDYSFGSLRGKHRILRETA